MQTVGYVIIAILILMVMITVHELGHYLVGKIFKFKINEFAIGMGPAIFKKPLKSGEIFSLRVLPLGGFCAFEGEDDDGTDPNSFNNKKPWQRILVLLAGATMNYILALLIIIFSLGCYGQSVFGGGKFIEDSAYSGYSLQDDDVILSVKNSEKRDKTNIYMSTDLISALNHKKKGEIVYVEVLRNGERLKDVPIKLRADVECKNITQVESTYRALGIGSTMMLTVKESDLFQNNDYIKKIGVGDGAIDQEYKDCQNFIYTYGDLISTLESLQVGEKVVFWVGREGFKGSQKVIFTVDEDWANLQKTEQNVLAYFGIDSYSYGYYTTGYKVKLGFFTTLGHSLEYSVKIGGTVLKSLGQIITGAIGLNAVGGTVTTIVTATKVISYGFEYALEIASLIGVNLAVFNLLPIPALDGSRIVFCIIEWIRRKPISRKIEGIIHAVGFIFILAFAVLVDLLQFI